MLKASHRQLRNTQSKLRVRKPVDLKKKNIKIFSAVAAQKERAAPKTRAAEERVQRASATTAGAFTTTAAAGASAAGAAVTTAGA